MNRMEMTTTNLLQLVESVSAQTRDEAETVKVVGHLLNQHRFVLAGDETRSACFEARLASLPATH